jgi:transcriptional regulator with XRE-family HTH domain
VLSPEEREAMRLAHRRKGLALKVIARRLGVCPHMLARYRCGERKPRRSLLDLWWKELS